MLTTRIFLKKTKRGGVTKTESERQMLSGAQTGLEAHVKDKPQDHKVMRRNLKLKVVREHYLRDDIICGSEICNFCSDMDSAAILDAKPSVNSSKAYKNPHYLILDTNVVLHQIDVLEENVFYDVIILQTVLEEVYHKSTAVYKRIKDIIRNRSRRFYLFVNEHHKDTYVEKMPNESPNDRNDRAIRAAASWYEEHLMFSQADVHQDHKIKIILLTDDANCRKCATAEGILSCTVEDYICCLNDAKGLIDKIVHMENTSIDSCAKEIFPCHISIMEIQSRLKSKSILQGTFFSSRENFLEGNVLVEGFDEAILVQGRSNLNRAVDGDRVAIQLLPKEEWSEPSELILEDTAIDDLDDDDTLEDNILKTGAVSKKTPTGKIVGIVKRKWRQYCGILQESTQKNSTRHIFVPADRKIPKIRIETRQYETLKSQRIVVGIDSWPRNSRYPLGHFIRALGEIDDENTENEVILLEHDVPHYTFPDKVNSCLPKLPWIITSEDRESRADLRDLDICSVDPPGCTDIDDALHCKLLDNGNYEVGVHIADVSHFVRPATAIDSEAALRGTTVYLTAKRIDMLPDLLSSNLCSLRADEERFAFSCIWNLNANADILSTLFTKSIIRSKKSFTYEEAQFIIDDPRDQSSISKSLRGLNTLAKVLKRKRIENGALVLASPEVRFRIDNEVPESLAVECKKLCETNSMVEEFMLLANISVAKQIYKEFPDCALLRSHPEPPQSNFEPLVKAAQHLGFKISTETGKQLADSLDAAIKVENPYFNTMLRIIATRCMMQAVYFCTGMQQASDFFHYGLAVPMYTHFTSPIRRYADLIVHRLLAACIGADTTYASLVEKKKIHDLCQNLNYRHKMAQYAGRASVALYTHIYFRNKVQDEEGYILYVRKNGLQILIPKYGLEGTLYFSKSNSSTVTFVFNEHDQSQSCGDVIFRSFDPVTVQLSLDKNNIQHQKLVLKLVKPFIPNFSVKSLNTENYCEMREENPTEQNSIVQSVNKNQNKKRKKKKEQCPNKKGR